jgi:GDP-L-fucose synthase
MKIDKTAKIFVAGHTGMVGSTILRILREKGYSNFVLIDVDDLDLRRQSDTEEFFASEKPDYVFLAAAKVGGIQANNTYKAEFIYDNLMIATNVINSAYKYGVKKLLNLGSSCIYPKLAPQPLKEEYLLSGYLEETNEPYAIAKIVAIKLCKYYNEQYGTDYFSVMPTNLYGNNDNYNLETSHVLPALIRKIILAKALNEGNEKLILDDLRKRKIGFGLEKKYDLTDINASKFALSELGIGPESVRVWGTGNVLREFLHADDMAGASIYLMENFSGKDIGDFVNIGTGVDLTIKDLVALVKNIVGFTGEIIFDINKPEGTPRKLLDVSKINNLGWKATITLEDGIKKIVAKYLADYE